MNNKVEIFRETAIERWKHLDNGNASKGNKCYNKLIKLYDDLAAEDGTDELALLLDDSNNSVRYECATKLLFSHSKKAQMILEELCNEKGHIAFVAEQTLKWWKKRQEESQ